MPWKLILFIICLVLLAFFIGFNLENACNVNFGFKQFDNVPVFLTVLFSVLVGVLITLPFTFGKRKHKVEKPASSVKALKSVKPFSFKSASSKKSSTEPTSPAIPEPSEQAKD